MNEQDYQQLRERSWRRPLTAAEEDELRAYLLQNPALKREWEEDQAMSHALRRLPDVPCSSNFTALVLQAVEQDQRQQRRPLPAARAWWAAWLPFAPRLASGALLVVAGVATYWHFQAASQQRLTEQFGSLSTAMGSVTTPEVWQDFDEIDRLRQVASVGDDALIEFLR